MGMADIIASYRPFSTDFTFTRHDIYTPYNGLFVKSIIIHAGSEKAMFFLYFSLFLNSAGSPSVYEENTLKLPGKIAGLSSGTAEGMIC
jgi:hypothetical protein